MTSFPDPDQSGSYAFRAPNAKGKISQFGTKNDADNTTFLRMAGQGGLEFINRLGEIVSKMYPNGQSTGGYNPGNFQIVFPPGPGPFTADVDPTKSLIVVATTSGPVTLNLPPITQQPYFFYIIGVDSTTIPGPMSFPLILHPAPGEGINDNGGADVVITNNYQMNLLFGPNPGGWGAFFAAGIGMSGGGGGGGDLPLVTFSADDLLVAGSLNIIDAQGGPLTMEVPNAGDTPGKILVVVRHDGTLNDNHVTLTVTDNIFLNGDLWSDVDLPNGSVLVMYSAGGHGWVVAGAPQVNPMARNLPLISATMPLPQYNGLYVEPANNVDDIDITFPLAADSGGRIVHIARDLNVGPDINCNIVVTPASPDVFVNGGSESTSYNLLPGQALTIFGNGQNKWSIVS